MKEDARVSMTLVVESAPPNDYGVQAVRGGVARCVFRKFDEDEVKHFETPTTMWQPSRSSMGVIAFLIGLLPLPNTGESATGTVVKPIFFMRESGLRLRAGILKQHMHFLAPLFRKNGIETSKLFRKLYSRNS